MMQDGTATYSRRGFFNTPQEESKWPRCLEGLFTHLNFMFEYVLLVILINYFVLIL